MPKLIWLSLLLAIGGFAIMPAKAADEPDLIFKRSTVFKLLTPNDKLATYGLDDPEVEGVACHFTVPERGGVKGWLGVAEEVSDISLACRQIGPIRFKSKFAQGDDVFRKRRSLFFKKMQIVRGCDTKRNVLVYMVYSIASSKARRRIPPRQCRSCLGAKTTRSSAARISSRNRPPITTATRRCGRDRPRDPSACRPVASP
jgi:CreA protein